MGGDLLAELVQRQRVPGRHALPGGLPGAPRARVDQVGAEVRFSALLADVAVRAAAAAGAASGHTHLVEVFAGLVVEQRGGLQRPHRAGLDHTGEEAPQALAVGLVRVRGRVLLDLDVHHPKRLGDLGGEVRRRLRRGLPVALGAVDDVALVVVAAGEVPGVHAVRPLEPDERVRAEVRPGQVPEVQVAVRRRRRGEHEDGAVAEPAPARGLRGGLGGVSPVQVEEDQVLLAGVLDDVGLERLEPHDGAGRDRAAPVVDDQLARAADDDEDLGLVVLVRIAGRAGNDPAPARAGSEPGLRAHVDAERLGQVVGVVLADDHALVLCPDPMRSRSAVSAATAGANR